MKGYEATFYRLMVASLLLAGLACVGTADLESFGGAFPIPTTLGSEKLAPPSEIAAPECVETGTPESVVHQAMFEALNAYRVENGLNSLIYSKRLEEAANAHVQDLYWRDFFAHVNPDGESPGDRAVEAGFCHKYVGENLAAGQPNVEAAMIAWQKSPSHNENMLEPDYKYVGMGFFMAPSGRLFWAQLLALDVP